MDRLNKYIQQIENSDASYGQRAETRQKQLTKPEGSLGRLEEIACEISSMKREDIPTIGRKAVFIFAADHGVVEEGVSAFPAEVTAQMCMNFLHNGAAINVLARHAGADLFIADVGVASDINTDNANFINRKIAYGTSNFTQQKAMSCEQAVQSIMTGISIFENENEQNRIDLVATGEMGIGNTTSATAILCAVADLDPAQITGMGTGLDDEGINRKINSIRKGIMLHNPKSDDGLDILEKVGGYEIGGMAGVILAAAKNRIPVLIDGVIATSAAIIASRIQPKCIDYMIASHHSEESMHAPMLELLGKKPLVDFNMRLGEGTGAALCMHIIEAGVKILAEMATFEEAGISDKQS